MLAASVITMDPELYRAVKSGNTCILKEILNKNPSLLTKLTPQENTPLHIAVQFGRINSVAEIYHRSRSLLISPNLDGDTPLHVAARYGEHSIVGYLIREALQTLREIEQGQSSIFDILRQRNKENDTVLHEAIRNGHTAIVELLLSIDPELACFENYAGESPLFLASREGMTDIVNKLLTSNPSLLHGGPDGLTALHAAVMERHSDIIDILLRAKIHLVIEVDHHGRTPLYYAASLRDLKTVKRLLELDISAAYVSDKSGYSALHIAAENGHTNVIEHIIYCCPDSAELLDLKGRSSLHCAVLAGKANIVRYMLGTAEFEGIINKADDDKNTPLHLAAIERKTCILRYLMWDGRVHQSAKNKNGETIFDIDKSIRESCIIYPENIVKSLWWKLDSRPTTLTKNQEPISVMHASNYRQTGQALLMVATLIATVTFTAAFTMPGGYNQGKALLQSTIQLKYFVISDSIAMTCSITAACIIFWGSIGSNESYVYFFASATVLTCIALLSTGIAFSSGIVAVMPDKPYVMIIAKILGCIFPVSTVFFLLQLVQIFPFSEICQFLDYRLRNVNK